MKFTRKHLLQLFALGGALGVGYTISKIATDLNVGADISDIRNLAKLPAKDCKYEVNLPIIAKNSGEVVGRLSLPIKFPIEL